MMLDLDKPLETEAGWPVDLFCRDYTPSGKVANTLLVGRVKIPLRNIEEIVKWDQKGNPKGLHYGQINYKLQNVQPSIYVGVYRAQFDVYPEDIGCGLKWSSVEELKRTIPDMIRDPSGSAS